MSYAQVRLEEETKRLREITEGHDQRLLKLIQDPDEGRAKLEVGTCDL
jgi:hypothetical protein